VPLWTGPLPRSSLPFLFCLLPFFAWRQELSSSGPVGSAAQSPVLPLRALSLLGGKEKAAAAKRRCVAVAARRVPDGRSLLPAFLSTPTISAGTGGVGGPGLRQMRDAGKSRRD
jgi:hypothetical protein